MEVFKIKNECGVTIVKVEQMSLPKFGMLMARIHNEIPEGQGISLDELCNRIDDVSREMIQIAIEELIKDGEICEKNGLYLLLEEIDKIDFVFNIINGNGEISYEELLEKTGIDEKELNRILKSLIEDGEIYEPIPRTYRIL